MKTIISIALLLLFTSYSFSQDLHKFGRQKPFLGMKGKVKTVTEETFDLKQENNTIVFESQGKSVFEFSKKGELKRKTTSYDDYKSSITYLLYENGRAMRFEQEISKPTYLDKDSSRIFIIDHRNERLVTWRNYNHEYAQTDTTLICYSGDITEISPLSNIRKLKITEIRDSQGNLIRETRSLRDKVASWCSWDYDENGLLISENGTRPAGFGMMDDYSFFYDYEDFDKQGNWRQKTVKVKESVYDENSDMVAIKIVKRQIKYY